MDHFVNIPEGVYSNLQYLFGKTGLSMQFSFLRSEECAQKAQLQLNGKSLQCGENTVTLYLSYVDSGTCLKHPQVHDLL